MDLTSTEQMAKLAEDVRAQEEPFIAAAVGLFESQFTKEYRRLRASALESGVSRATLNVTVTCNFDEKNRSVDITTVPAPVSLKPHRNGIAVG